MAKAKGYQDRNYRYFPLETAFDEWQIIFDSSKNSMRVLQNKLDIPTDMHVLIFAELHLWDGKKNAVKALHITNASQLTKGYDTRFQIGVSHNAELLMKGIHHDGTNYYYFRVLKRPDEYNPPGDNLMESWLKNDLSVNKIDRNSDKIGNTVLKALGKKTIFQKTPVKTFEEYLK